MIGYSNIQERRPETSREAYSAQQKFDGVVEDRAAKLRLADKTSLLMTAERLAARDPAGEVQGWFRQIGEML
ncbi:hypothetical protein WI73_28995 [Burkholderia ubonensis]|nr:hypothetical protein WI73_28995 [Burkholderia ubonensis]